MCVGVNDASVKVIVSTVTDTPEAQCLLNNTVKI